MARKVYVDVKVRLIINMDEGIEVNTVLENMDYSFTSMTDDANIEDTEIEEWEVTDSK